VLIFVVGVLSVLGGGVGIEDFVIDWRQEYFRTSEARNFGKILSLKYSSTWDSPDPIQSSSRSLSSRISCKDGPGDWRPRFMEATECVISSGYGS
jgi:hypothetical protein